MRNFNLFCWLLIFMPFIAVGLMSCSDSKDSEPVDPYAGLKYSPAALMFKAEPEAPLEFSLSGAASYDALIVRTDVVWCSVKAEGQGRYTVTCQPNTSPEPRSCNVKVFAGDVAKVVVPVSQAGYTAPEPDEPSVSKPENAASPLGLGWNLGNQMDAHNNGLAGETFWGNPEATKQLFTAVRNAGFSSVRIPVTWLGKVGPAPDYKIDSQWLDRVATLVGWAEEAGLKVVVNIHHDGADSAYWLDIKNAATSSAKNAEVEAQLKAMWTQIAEKFADKGDFLYFESMNEIHDGGWGWGDNRKNSKQYTTFNGWQKVFVDAVRATGGNNANRWLIVPTYCTNIDLGDHLVLPEDPAGRLIVAVHLYEPFEYTLNDKYSEWGHTGNASLKPNSNEATLVAEFDKISRKWLSKGIPAYIGEFGCSRRDTERAEAFRKYYLEYFCKAASDRNIPVFYWDNGVFGKGRESGGLFNRSTGLFENNAADVVAVMVRGFNTTSPDYTLESVYATAP